MKKPASKRPEAIWESIHATTLPYATHVASASSVLGFANDVANLPSVLPDGTVLDVTAQDDGWKDVDFTERPRRPMDEIGPELQEARSVASQITQARRQASKAAIWVRQADSASRRIRNKNSPDVMRAAAQALAAKADQKAAQGQLAHAAASSKYGESIELSAWHSNSPSEGVESSTAPRTAGTVEDKTTRENNTQLENTNPEEPHMSDALLIESTDELLVSEDVCTLLDGMSEVLESEGYEVEEGLTTLEFLEAVAEVLETDEDLNEAKKDALVKSHNTVADIINAAEHVESEEDLEAVDEEKDEDEGEEGDEDEDEKDDEEDEKDDNKKEESRTGVAPYRTLGKFGKLPTMKHRIGKATKAYTLNHARTR